MRPRGQDSSLPAGPDVLVEERLLTGRFDLNRRRLLAAVEERGFKVLVLASEENLVYALGARWPSGVAVLSEECGYYWLVPALDYSRALEAAPPEFEVKAYYRSAELLGAASIPRKDLLSVDGIVDAVAKILDGCEARIGADLSWLRDELASGLREKLSVEDVSEAVWSVRKVKEDWEVQLIEEAQHVSEDALSRALDSLTEEAREEEVAGLINYELRRRGAWGEAFPTIVAFHANTAYPHHPSGPMALSQPGPVLVDMGAIVGGYRSDMTRTLWWGGGEPRQFRSVLEVVLEALEEAVDTVAPGVEARDIDNAARRRLEKAGLKQYFIHGTGHGVGVEIHEPPYLRPGSEDVLEPGMIVTVEPGVYIPGRFGVRIEDMVLVTRRGRRVLTRIARLLPA